MCDILWEAALVLNEKERLLKLFLDTKIYNPSIVQVRGCASCKSSDDCCRDPTSEGLCEVLWLMRCETAQHDKALYVYHVCRFMIFSPIILTFKSSRRRGRTSSFLSFFSLHMVYTDVYCKPFIFFSAVVDCLYVFRDDGAKYWISWE